MQDDVRTDLRRPEFLILAALAFLTRFWGLFYPRVVVWDEVHFERFAGAYRSGKARWWYLGAVALAAGMAASTKWTGLSALGLIGLAWIVEGIARRQRVASLVREGLVLAVVPALVYVGSFAVHFKLLGLSGPFAQRLVYTNRDMQAMNVAWATDTNAAASPWYTWPIS